MGSAVDHGGSGPAVDQVGAGGAQQLVLEVIDAHEEPEPLQLGPIRDLAESGSGDRSAEVLLLADIAEPPTTTPSARPCSSRSAPPIAWAPPMGTTTTPSAPRSRPRTLAATSIAI